MSFQRRIRDRLAADRARGLQRSLPPVHNRVGVTYDLGPQRVVGFCSNDYLGLADDPSLARAGQDASSGASGSRLICGDLPIHREVEARLAALVGLDDAVLFPSGFQLNVGVLPSVLEPDDLVYSDALNHASLIDGLRLCPAPRRILPHGTVPPASTHPLRGLRWWVTESVFSMDGDRVDTGAVARFIAEGGCLYVDEAHAIGLFDGGRGLTGDAGITPTLSVGTLSKAFGCAGAFVAGSADACHFIRTRARSFVFSTGPSPAVVARIAAAIDLVRGAEGDRRRARLWDNARRLAHAFGLADAPPSPIFPVLVGDNDLALQTANALLHRGFHVQPIRPPTVPHDTARLRITVTAAHTEAQIDALAEATQQILTEHGLSIVVDRGRTDPLPVSASDQHRPGPLPKARRA